MATPKLKLLANGEIRKICGQDFVSFRKDCNKGSFPVVAASDAADRHAYDAGKILCGWAWPIHLLQATSSAQTYAVTDRLGADIHRHLQHWC